MLQVVHSAILSTFIKLPFLIKIFVLSIFEWPFYTGFTVHVRFIWDRNQYLIGWPIIKGIDIENTRCLLISSSPGKGLRMLVDNVRLAERFNMRSKSRAW